MRTIAVDIGNSYIHCGIFEGTRLLRHHRSGSKPFDETRLKKFARELQKDKKNDSAIVSIASCVPEINTKVKTLLCAHGMRACFFIPRDVKVPIVNTYRTKNTLGADRLINAYAAKTLYGAPVVAIDFGTAITIDCVSARGAYVGGLILPGGSRSLDCMLQSASILKKHFGAMGATTALMRVRRARPIEKTSVKNITSGTLLGVTAMIARLCEEYKKLLGKNLTIVLTGKEARLYAPHLRHRGFSFMYDEYLTVRGVSMVIRKKFLDIIPSKKYN